MKTIYHVSKRENDGREWKVFQAGSNKVIRVFKTQKEAVDYVNSLQAVKNKEATVIVHGLDGKMKKN